MRPRGSLGEVDVVIEADVEEEEGNTPLSGDCAAQERVPTRRMSSKVLGEQDWDEDCGEDEDEDIPILRSPCSSWSFSAQDNFPGPFSLSSPDNSSKVFPFVSGISHERKNPTNMNNANICMRWLTQPLGTPPLSLSGEKTTCAITAPSFPHAADLTIHSRTQVLNLQPKLLKVIHPLLARPAGRLPRQMFLPLLFGNTGNFF